jgi:hypothetical protein
MAKADTYEMESGGFRYDKRGCAICGEPASRRGFYYPTFMNGDAEWLGDYCKEHKGTNLAQVNHGKVPLRYEIGEDKL